MRKQRLPQGSGYLYSRKVNGGSDDREFLQNDYSQVCRGDSEAVMGMLQKGEMSLKNNGRCLSCDTFRNMLFGFVIESEVLAGNVISAGMGRDETYALADIYAYKADKCVSCEQLEGLFSDMCLDFTERMGEIKKEAAVSLHIRKCIAYIYSNLNADLSVKGLAAHLGLDPSYLSRLFSKETGSTVKRFVTKAKISTSCDLLRNTSLRYIEIAYSLGFSTQSMFIRTFKSEMGLTPKKYREQNGV